MTLIDDLQIALDPVQFANTTLGIIPDNWQAQAISDIAYIQSLKPGLPIQY